MQILLNLLSDLITIIFDIVGNLGLLFFLLINVVNIYSYWWAIPKNVQAKIRINPAQSEAFLRTLNIHRTIANVGVLIIPLGIVLAPGPALWLKVMSGTLILLVLVYLVGSLWLFITKGISVALPPIRAI
jgi:hypothetical protein